MATEFKHTRRRTNSSAVRNSHVRGLSRQVLTPKSSHTSDEFLQPFLSPAFDPASFINSNLPPVQQRSTFGQDGSASTGQTAELSTQAQTMINQLNAHTTRLSNTLTQLTDDILRSGSRLAYEVELLRGETLSLTETMNETLQEDIKKFIPEGLDASDESKKDQITSNGEPGDVKAGESGLSDSDPQYLKQLQTLTLVRERLESVIKTFGDAMDFIFPPSELSVGSSFLSVSAPEPGPQQQSSEEKGQQVLKKFRDEISALLSGSEDAVEGIAKAAQRVEELKELTSVWKDTAEEKGRNKFIDGLAKMVEDTHKELMKEMEQVAKKDPEMTGGRPRKSSITRSNATPEEAPALPGGFGLLHQLQRLRSGL